MESGRSDRDTPSSKRSEYDVFLSFRGPDARHGIVDHLYECMTDVGLRVFKDDEEIRRGQVIGGELKRAIDVSRVYAVVFSRNYASSAWCLRELDMMVDFYGGSNVGRKIILPIFYRVDPEDVKLRTEVYREALNAHKDRHGQELVKKWEEALKMVGGISGWDSKAIQGEGRFVRLIVQDIVVKLRIKDQSLPNHLTGIDDRLSDMLNLMDCDSSGVRLVVLHGMGGIGKTTLASVIFNKLSSQFQGSSFISNVRESATGHGGIAKLQNKLSRDILGDQYARSCNFDDGFGEIIQRIPGKRMLLVLDDVDKFSHLEKLVGNDLKDALGTGSRVIITTRDKSIFHRFVRLGSEILHLYEMEKMSDNHALQLFSRHAFGTNEPPEDYLTLSKKVVETTGNLPLALEVIGGHLCCQSKESWEDMLEKLKSIPQKEVFEVLKVSYDGLDGRDKEIFLDIACFRRDGMPRRYADYLWEARNLYPKTGVKVLINKSLIKINSRGEFWIHDQLRDMGREIIRSEGLERPEMRTRLWDRDDALKVVLQKKVSEKIIAIQLHLESDDEELKLSDENFRGLSNLKYLHLEGMHQFIGNFGSIQETLVWLSWSDRKKWSNPDIFEMSSLVVLKINGGWGSFEKLMMPKLRVLQIEFCDMISSPDLSCCLKLEIMVFEQCHMLEEIHHSVGKLDSLTHMEISGCDSLRSLPEKICYARALRELIVTHCRIEEVPESIGMLESLTTLNLWNNSIRRLPATIGDLENLLVMQAGLNPLEEEIPEEIGNLSSLQELNLSYTDIPFLPATASQLTSLKSLKLGHCRKLRELRGIPTSITKLHVMHCPLDKGIPEEIGNLSALKEWNLSHTNIPFLPATVSQLTSLKSLKLEYCWELRELRGLPTSLTELRASFCPLDKGIPKKVIGSLSSLEELDLSHTDIPFLPATVSQLTSLKSLRLYLCGMLQELRGLPTSITKLHATYCPLDKGIPEEIGNLSALEELNLSHTNIPILPATVSQLTSLKSLTLKRCKMLEELPRLPTSLTHFTFSWETVGLSEEVECGSEVFSPKRIIKLKGDLELGILSRLKTLGLTWSLDTELEIKYIRWTEMELGGRLRSELKWLHIDGCPALVEIPGLEQLELLEELTISCCDSIRVPRVNDECRLWIEECDELESFDGTYGQYRRKFDE